MRVVVLTSRSRGFASVALLELARAEGVDVRAVVYNRGRPRSRWRRLKRNFRKARRIGLLGALNGLRMRSWYGEDVRKWIDVERIEVVTERCSIPLRETFRIASDTTVRHFEEVEADLGLSLGNGYIPSYVFRIPRFGMLNVHHELLPEFRGAQSVLWQIHEGSTMTGFSIHQIDEHIDTGAVLHREPIPIEFRESLAETVSYNYARLWRESAERLPEVVREYQERASVAEPQGEGRSYTTPTLSEYLLTLVRHRRLLKREAEGQVGASRPPTE